VAFKVLIVDDSAFFQSRLKEIINECPELQVIGIAGNGQEAIELDQKLKPDVISMDYEMPFIDGITAVRAILERRSVPIIMFSSMTYEGARITLDALEAGAVDFMPKNFAEVSQSSQLLKKRLHEKLVTFARGANASASVEKKKPPHEPARQQNPAPQNTKAGSRITLKNRPKILLIGASTGGPVAIAEVIKSLPSTFSIPIVVVQHMPENFTKAFAERLNRQVPLYVKEAENGDRLQNGHVYIAPGGLQTMFDRGSRSIKIIPGDNRVNYKPSVDISFGSAAQVFGESVLAIVLTGMGSDGCEGARLLKQKGASIWAQNEATCVVYGMPAAIARNNLADHILPIKDIGPKLSSSL
jgi:two-component system chemotaxis response regulator CheB